MYWHTEISLGDVFEDSECSKVNAYLFFVAYAFRINTKGLATLHYIY